MRQMMQIVMFTEKMTQSFASKGLILQKLRIKQLIQQRKVAFRAWSNLRYEFNVASTDAMTQAWRRLWRRNIAGVRFTL